MDTINHAINLGKLVILEDSNETRVNRFIKGRYSKYKAGIPLTSILKIVFFQETSGGWVDLSIMYFYQ